MCKYCEETIEISTIGEFHSTTKAYIDKDDDDGSYLVITSSNETDCLAQWFEIDFCPMCGDKL